MNKAWHTANIQWILAAGVIYYYYHHYNSAEACNVEIQGIPTLPDIY